MKPTELYPAAYVARAKRNNQIWTVAVCLFALGCLAVCVALCLRLNTANADRTQLLVCAISAVGGWIVILLLTCVVLPGKRELAHIRSLEHEPRECVAGLVTPDAQRVPIRGSITVQRLQVHASDGTRRVSVNVRALRRMPKLPAQLTLYTAHGYVVAWEVDACE